MGVGTKHLVLARKYRPGTFGEVIEQKAAVHAIVNALKSNRLGSAYLFFGPRGVGKTTIARILAKRVNCLSPREEEPCSVCESCMSITEGNSMDVIEIDAASHRGIQHIRELRENIGFRPMSGHKKVYIIDEVHMLTNESFNALLKTLEEPPSHVLFILATTEFNKIPETILSRCQVFTFRKAPLQVVIDYTKELCEREKIQADEEALFWIARKGDCSIRDTLSFMEQAITYCDGNINTASVKELIGAVPMDVFLGLTITLLDKDSKEADLIQPIHDMFVNGNDLNRFVWEYLDFMRTLILIRQNLDNPEMLGIWKTDIALIKQTFIDTETQLLILIFNDIYKLLSETSALKLRNSYETRILIEISLISLKEKLSRPSLSGIIQKLNKLTASIEGGVSSYSAESELQKQFLGTVVEPGSIPKLEI